MPTCTGQCQGCAFKPGATANLEANNRITAIMSAVAGEPFYCHDKLGWTPDQDGYPSGKPAIQNSISNLLTAPKLIHNSPEIAHCISDATPTGFPPSAFEEDRAIIGRNPICAGWKAVVRDLARQGWFQRKEKRQERRRMANEALECLREIPDAGEREKKVIFGDIGSILKWFVSQMKEQQVYVPGLFDGGKK